MVPEKGLFGSIELKDIPDDMREDFMNLASRDGQIRERSRNRLVAKGNVVTKYIVHLLDSYETHVRWEAAKTLEQLADVNSVKYLIDSFGDPDPSVRWLAAEAVINTGKAGLRIVLKDFLEKPDIYYYKRAVHHIINEMEEVRDYRESKELAEAIDENLDTVIPVPAGKLLIKLEE